MSRMYTLAVEGQSISAAMDVLSALPASGKAIVCHSAELTQASDYGDAAAEGIRVALVRGHTTAPSGGSSITARVHNPSQDPACSATTRSLDTTIASAGTGVFMHPQGANVQSGYFYRPTPEERFLTVPGEWLVLRLMSAPIDALVISGWMVIEELG